MGSQIRQKSLPHPIHGTMLSLSGCLGQDFPDMGSNPQTGRQDGPPGHCWAPPPGLLDDGADWGWPCVFDGVLFMVILAFWRSRPSSPPTDWALVVALPAMVSRSPLGLPARTASKYAFWAWSWSMTATR